MNPEGNHAVPKTEEAESILKKVIKNEIPVGYNDNLDEEKQIRGIITLNPEREVLSNKFNETIEPIGKKYDELTVEQTLLSDQVINLITQIDKDTERLKVVREKISSLLDTEKGSVKYVKNDGQVIEISTDLNSERLKRKENEEKNLSIKIRADQNKMMDIEKRISDISEGLVALNNFLESSSLDKKNFN